MDQLIVFSFNEKSATLLVFFVNAMVFSTLLLRKSFQDDQQHSKWLALFVFLCGLYLCPFMFGYAGWYARQAYREFLFFVPFQQLFLLGPVIYFYTRSLLDKQFKLDMTQLLHFLPAALYLLYSLIVFIIDKLVLDTFYFYADGRDKDLVFWYQMSGLVSLLCYLVLSMIAYRRYRRRIVQEVSFADEVLFKWIKHFLIALMIISLLRIVFFISNPEWDEFGSKYWYYLCFSIVTYYIALAGYRHASTVGSVKFKRVENPQPPSTNTTSSAEEVASDSSLDILNWKIKLEQLMETQSPYTDPQLTLTDLAEILGTNRNVLSTVINQSFKINFNDYINKNRVEAVIEKIDRGEHKRKNLLGIALEAGFNSKSTFNRAFKRHRGLTPSKYLEKRLDK